MKLLEKLNDSQKAFIKKVLGMYISNNILDENDLDDINEYINGMLIDDEFYYTIDCIVDEVIDEPEWIPQLEAEGIDKELFTKEEWQSVFKEILKTIDHDFMYIDCREEIAELNKQIEAEIEQVRIRKEEEEKKRQEEEKKKREEEERKKKEEEAAAEPVEAEEVKDASV